MKRYAQRENIVLPNIKNLDKFQKTLDNLLSNSPRSQSLLSKYQHREGPFSKGKKSINRAAKSPIQGSHDFVKVYDSVKKSGRATKEMSPPFETHTRNFIGEKDGVKSVKVNLPMSQTRFQSVPPQKKQSVL